MHLKLHTKFLLPMMLVLALVMGVATFVSYTVASQALLWRLAEHAAGAIHHTCLAAAEAP